MSAQASIATAKRERWRAVREARGELRPRPPRLAFREALLLAPAVADPEVARLLHPQPPLPIPARVFPARWPGHLAYQVLGCRIITPHEVR